MRSLRLTTIITYCTTFTLGLGIKRGWWHTRGFQWLHHSLFAAIWVSTLTTVVAGWANGIRAWFAPLAVLLWMAPLPAFRAGSRMHEALATGGLLTLFVTMYLSRNHTSSSAKTQRRKD